MIELPWYFYLIGIIAFVLVLGLIILIHEGGHFLLAKKAGILCHEFSLGMGPVIYQKKIGETVYSIRAIPIGGYVSMAGEEVNFDALKGINKVKLEFNELNKITKIIVDIDNPKYDGMTVYNIESYDIIGTKDELPGELFMEVYDSESDEKEVIRYEVATDAMMYFPKKQMAQIAPYNRNFANKSLLQRFLAVFAGPAMNFVLAFILFVLLGFTRGYPKKNSTEIDTVDKNAPIYVATYDDVTKTAIEKGDKIVSINGVEITEWEDLQDVMNKIASGEKYIYTENENCVIGHEVNYQGYLVINYLDKSDNNALKEVKVIPNTYIYNVQLLFKNEGVYTDGMDITKPIVGSFNKNNNKTLTYKAGLREGDLITGVAIGEKKSNPSELTYMKVNNKNELIEYFKNMETFEESKYVFFEYTRTEKDKDGNVLEVKEKQYTSYIETYSKALLESSNIDVIKLEMGVTAMYEFNFVKLLYYPFVETFDSAFGIVKNLGLLFNPKANVGLDDFSSFLGIYELITSSVAEGFNSLVYIAAFLSVNIGFVNLLPLPALDGGRLAFILFEAITRKKPSPKVENIIHTIGLFALFGLMGFIVINELLKYIGISIF